MSLEALPTELDVAIIDYLEQGDLTELSLVSKYYRQVAEPRLYNSVHFHDSHEDRVKLLLFTLIKRKDLRSSVHHFTVRHVPQAPRPKTPDLAPQILEPLDDGNIDLCDILMAHAPRITKLVSDLAYSYKINAHLKMEMFASIFGTYPHYDGALALILCLITKVVSIELDVINQENLVMTRFMLEHMKWTAGPSMYDYPFCALKRLRIQGVDSENEPYHSSFDAGIHPAMEILDLRNNTNLNAISVPQQLPHLTAHHTVNLTTLTFREVNFDPSMLEALIASRWCANIKALLVFGAGQPYNLTDAEWLSYDYSKLKRVMAQHLPHLQYFTWLDLLCQRGATPFGPFTKFRELKELLLDYDMLFDETDPGISELLDYFPPSLEILELSGASLCCWNTMYTHAIHHRGYYLTRLEDFQLVASLMPFKELMVTIDMDCEDPVGHSRLARILDEPVIGMFRRVADTMHVAGTTMTVWYRWNSEDMHLKLLVAPDFTTTVIRDANDKIIQRSEEGDLTGYTSDDGDDGERRNVGIAENSDPEI